MLVQAAGRYWTNKAVQGSGSARQALNITAGMVRKLPLQSIHKRHNAQNGAAKADDRATNATGSQIQQNLMSH